MWMYLWRTEGWCAISIVPPPSIVPPRRGPPLSLALDPLSLPRPRPRSPSPTPLPRPLDAAPTPLPRRPDDAAPPPPSPIVAASRRDADTPPPHLDTALLDNDPPLPPLQRRSRCRPASALSPGGELLFYSSTSVPCLCIFHLITKMLMSI